MENIVEKGEIAHMSNVTFFYNIFLTLSQASPGFYVSAVQVLWKHSGKRRNSS